jgi:hypothetical protein
MIIPPEGLIHVPPGIQDILTIVGDTASAVREPLHTEQNRIDILLDNLLSSTTDLPSLTFEDITKIYFSMTVKPPTKQESTTKSSKPTGLLYKNIPSLSSSQKLLSKMASMFSATQIEEQALCIQRRAQTRWRISLNGSE